MTQVLLSVPPHLRDFLHSRPGLQLLGGRLAEPAGGRLFVGTDPKSRRLGSGGGAVHLLHQAWLQRPPSSPPTGLRRGDFRARAAPENRKKTDIWEWLAEEQRLVLNAGGESRRLPAYAALGKALMPLPPIDGLAPRRFDQTLADFQMPAYRQVLHEAGPRAAALVTAGDVWLDFDPLQIPAVSADIVGIGMRASPETARDFGVYFVGKRECPATSNEAPISFFLQKPRPAEIRRRAVRHNFYVDTGMWLLSLEALRLLFRRCGWDDRRQRFTTPDGYPAALDLYTEIGAVLGTESIPCTRLSRLGWARLKTSVIPLAEASFHHLGSTRQLFESFAEIQRGRPAPVKALCSATPQTAFASPPKLPVWLDGVSDRAPPLRLDGYNAVTGLPAAARLIRLARGWCVDVIPIGASDYALRPYHIDDNLRGTPGAGGRICRRSARAWLAARRLAAPELDVFDLPIYPVIPAAKITQELLAWFFAAAPDPKVSARVAGCRRLSAARLPTQVNFARYFALRRDGHAQTLRAGFAACRRRPDDRIFSQDFAAIAGFCRKEAPALGRWLRRHRTAILRPIVRPEHASRLLLLFAELGGAQHSRWRTAGRHRLQTALVAAHQLLRVRPRLRVPEGAIVFARGPVRLDLAGGWTDTPPYCLEHGGAVLNVAVLLNGQPPIQVWVRPLREPCIRLRSLDLGIAERVTTFARLGAFRDPQSGFALAKAALALAGFHPDFFRGRRHRSLRHQLRSFGGGLDISMQCDVPKGSGLGTSSILAVTLLGALNRACGLGWDEFDLYRGVLGIEQLLTTGGGWQDQAGALFRGIKLVRTQPGPAQTPAVRHLPSGFLDARAADSSLLLYYTGLTRLAKGILQEIVHDMVLGRSATLQTLNLIRANALRLYPAMRKGDASALHRCIARSWELNRRLDAGTTTPEIERIISACGPDLAACKLLGAGGGGYLLLCAASPEAGRRIRARLEARPPNSRAGFADFCVSPRTLEVSIK